MNANPAFASLLRAAKSAVKNRGYLIGLDGRKIYCDSDFKALNYLIQSNGALICKKWLELIDTELKRKDLDAKIVAWVHDEVQIKTREGIEDVVGNISRRMARQAGEYFQVAIPIDAEFTTGGSWATTH